MNAKEEFAKDRVLRITRPLQNRSVRVLSESEVTEIHGAALCVLEEMGAEFEDIHALERLSKAGGKVEGKRVKFPSSLVTKAIESAPREVVLKARDPQKSVFLGRGTVHVTGGFGASFVMESGSDRVRKATLKDLEDCTRLCDYLEHIDYCLKSVIPQDVPQVYADIHAAAVLFANTAKHIHISQDCPTQVEFITQKILELGRAAAYDAGTDQIPFFSLGLCPHSPLTYAHEPLIRMRIAVEAGIPFFLVCGAVSGVSAPVTLAGTLVVQHAELLAGLALTQVIRPGSEIVFGSFSSSADMATGKMVAGSPEQSILGIATQQLCDYCGIPYGYGTAGLTDSGLMDVQAGYDKGVGLALQMLGGVDVIHDGASGLLSSAMVMSKEQLVVDHEYVQILAHVMKGIDVTPETLAVDLIKSVGPGGSYLDADHTVSRFRKEFLISKLPDRPPSKVGPLDASHSMAVRAQAQVVEILTTHRPKPLPKGAETRLRSILNDLPPPGSA